MFPVAKCSSHSDLGNHIVELMGYGQQDGIPYWLVKNSWVSRGRHARDTSRAIAWRLVQRASVSGVHCAHRRVVSWTVSVVSVAQGTEVRISPRARACVHSRSRDALATDERTDG